MLPAPIGEKEAFIGMEDAAVFLRLRPSGLNAGSRSRNRLIVRFSDGKSSRPASGVRRTTDAAGAQMEEKGGHRDFLRLEKDPFAGVAAAEPLSPVG